MNDYKSKKENLEKIYYKLNEDKDIKNKIKKYIFLKNNVSKLYYYMLKNLKTDLNNYKNFSQTLQYNDSNKSFFWNYKKILLEKEKYDINCTDKPDKYDISSSLSNPEEENVYNYKNVYNIANKFLDNFLDVSNIIINDYIEDIPANVDNYNILGMKELIKLLDIEIQKKRLEIDEENSGKKNYISSLDEFVQNTYNNYDDEGNLIYNNVEFLSKKQKEVEIYEYLIYISYFVISSTLGFYFLYKNK